MKEAGQILAAAPDGYLITRRRTRSTSYYWSYKTKTASGWKSIQKNITKSPEIIHLLADKMVAVETVKICEQNLFHMQKLLKQYIPYERNQIVAGLSQKYQDVMAIRSQKHIGDWLQAPYEKCPFDPEKHIHETACGELVRSKSEVIIANALYSYGIPFHYEEKFPYPSENGDFYYPDFTILLPDGLKLIWEHLGLLKNMAYCIDNAQKLHTYQLNKVMIGKNLILTQDDYKGNCSSAFTYNIIQQYILPRFQSLQRTKPLTQVHPKAVKRHFWLRKYVSKLYKM